MKKSVSELSLTIVVIVSFVIISEIVLAIMGRSQNFIFQTLTNIFYSNNSGGSVNVLKNNVNFVSDINEESTDQDISNLFKHNIKFDNSFEEMNNELVSELSSLTKKNLKRIFNKKDLKCIDDCVDFSSLVSEEDDYKTSYYQFKDYYVVNVHYEDAKNDYSFIYTKNENVFWGNEYSLYSVKDDQINSKRKKSNKLVEREIDDFQTSFDYDTSYLSMASTNELVNFSKNEYLVEKVYYENIDSVVMLNTFNNGVITNSASGFFVTSDLIVTSFQYIKESLKNGNFITALTNSNESYDVLGVVALDSKSDLAFLKISEQFGKKVSFDDIREGEEILLLGTFGGFGISGQVGLNLTSADLQTNLLYTVSNNVGSPLFDSDGNVVGMVTSISNDKTISRAISSDLINKYLNVFSNRDYYTLNQLAKHFYLYDLEDEKVVNTIAKSTWDEYNEFGNLEQTISLPIVKGSQFENKISVRYFNDTSISSEDLLKEFISNLIDDGYKEKINTSKKKRYVSNNCQIIIFSDFDYITIVMERM